MKIFIALPIYKQAHPMTLASVRAAQQRLGDAVGLCVVEGDCLARARATLLAEFLEFRQDWTHMLQLDDDQSFDPNILQALAGLDLPVVGLPCAYKLDPPHSHAGYATVRGLPEERLRSDGVVKVKYLGGGFILWSRQALDAMAGAHPALEFTTNAPGHPRRRSFAFWNELVVDKELLSEDYAACELALRAGLDLWAYWRGCSPHWTGDRSQEPLKPDTWKAYVPDGFEAPTRKAA